jgi:hypothetical protein
VGKIAAILVLLAALVAPCFGGGSLVFTTDDYVTRASAFTADTETISIWFYTPHPFGTVTSPEVLVVGGFSGSDEYLCLGACSASMANEVITIVDDGAGRTYVASITIAAGWHQITLVWRTDLSDYDIFLDGVAQTESFVSGGAPLMTGDGVRLGSTTLGASDFTGNMAHLVMSKKSAATADESLKLAQELFFCVEGVGAEEIQVWWSLMSTTVDNWGTSTVGGTASGVTDSADGPPVSFCGKGQN